MTFKGARWLCVFCLLLLLFVSPSISAEAIRAIQGTPGRAVQHVTVQFGGDELGKHSLKSNANDAGAKQSLSGSPSTASSFVGFVRDGTIGSIPDTMGAVGPNHL